MTSREPLRLMAVLAHPDDESLGLGGLLAKCAAEGIETSLVTATRGDAGRYLTHRDGPEHPGREKLGEIREAELRAAAATLGVRHVVQLGYRDGELDQAEPREAIGRIAAEIARHRPQVVVTFPPDGAYGHPDHIAISQLATAAVVAAADRARPVVGNEGLAPHAVSKLYFFVATRDEWEIYQGVFKKLISTVDGVDREAVPWPDWASTTLVDCRAHWQQAWKAVQCHRSQIDSYGGLTALPADMHERLWGVRHLYRVFSTVNGGRKLETDAFEGLR